MNAKATRPRSDAVDVERFEQMVRSAAFGRFCARVEKQLDRECAFCETSSGEIELRRAQGAAQALRMVLELPKVLLAELKNGKG